MKMTGRKIVVSILPLFFLLLSAPLSGDIPDRIIATDTANFDSSTANNLPDKHMVYKEIIRTNRIIFIALPFFFAIILMVMIKINKMKNKKKKHPSNTE